MKLFALNGSEAFGELIASQLNISLSKHEERDFEDGEHKIRPLEDVNREEVFVIHSLYSDDKQSVNDKLCRLLFFISTLKDASAKKVTAVIPYLCYARKDRRTKPYDPVTSRYVAKLIEASGADAVMTIDIHNLQAFQNAFTIPAINLEARKIFSAYLATIVKGEDVVIMSPDVGGIKRAEHFVEALEKLLDKSLSLAFMEKYRSEGKVWGERVVGELKDKVVIIIDDLISTGGTIGRAAEACRQGGARKVLALATHGLFTGKPGEQLSHSILEQVIITNTIPSFRLENDPLMQKIVILDAAPLFAEAIKRSYEGGSIDELLVV